MRRLPFPPVACALLLLCGRPATAAQPADTTVVTTLPELTVTATRAPRDVLRVPHSVTRVPAAPAAARYRHFGPFLAGIAGVNGSETGPGQTTVRSFGLTGYHVAICVDGMRVDNSTQRSGPTEVIRLLDPFAFANLEVVRGPAGVLWGSGAAGGTFNALTPEAGGGRAGGLLSLRAATAEQSGSARLAGHAPGPLGTHWAGGVTARSFGDLVGGRATGRQEYTDYREGGADVKIERPLAGGALALLYQGYRQYRAPRTHATVWAVPFEGTVPGGDRVRDYDRLRDHAIASWRAGTGAPLGVRRLAVAWQRQREDEHRVTGSGSARTQGVEVAQLGFDAQFGAATPAGRLTWGGDAYYDYDVDSWSSTNPIQGPVGDDARYLVAGAYAQDELRLARTLELVAGARLTAAHARADRVSHPLSGEAVALRNDADALTTSVRLLHEVRPGRWSLFAGRSEGFRAPNLSDLTRFDLAEGNQIETPSDGLRPERFVTWEAGTTLRTGRATGSAGVFHTAIRDLIVRQPTGRMLGSEYEVRHANTGQGWVWGWQAEATLAAGRGVRLAAWAGWNDGELDQYPTSDPVVVCEPLSRVMPLGGGLRARWTPAASAPWLECEALAAARQDRLSTGDRVDRQRIPPGGTPGYAVVTLRGGVAVGRADFMLAIENLGDADYRIHGSGINAPGRNVVLGMNWTF